MPLKEYLIKKLSQKLHIPEKTVEIVVNDQFTEAFRATSSNNTIELSGFGKFIFSQPRAHRQMKKYEEQLVSYNEMLSRPEYASPDRQRNINMRIATTQKNIEHLKPKLREL